MAFEMPAEVIASVPAEQQQAFTESISHQSIQRYNSLPDLIKGHIEQSGYAGRSIGLPEKEADLEKWSTEQSAKLADRGYHITKREDVPADVNGYKFALPGMEDQKVLADPVLNSFRGVAHKFGIGQTKAQALLDWFAKEALPQMGVVKKFVTGDDVHKLVKEKFPDVDNKALVEDYNRVLEHLKVSDPDIIDFMQETISFGDGTEIALGDHPTFLRIMARAAPLLKPDFGGALNNQPTTPEGADLAKEAEDILRNPQNPKHKLYWENHRPTVEYVEGLFKKAFPGEVPVR